MRLNTPKDEKVGKDSTKKEYKRQWADDNDNDNEDENDDGNEI